MKEAVGGISLFNIVILFIVLFTGYISMSINYSKAFNVKNEIISIIKNQGGVCTSDNTSDICHNFQDQITDYFNEGNYRSRGKCESGWVGFDRKGAYLGDSADNAAFCVKGVIANSEITNALYYKVKVFYQLDLPIFQRLFQFRIEGETSRVYDPNECDANIGQWYSYPWCNEVKRK